VLHVARIAVAAEFFDDGGRLAAGGLLEVDAPVVAADGFADEAEPFGAGVAVEEDQRESAAVGGEQDVVRSQAARVARSSSAAAAVQRSTRRRFFAIVGILSRLHRRRRKKRCHDVGTP
jgi:hypothetical protein